MYIPNTLTFSHSYIKFITFYASASIWHKISAHKNRPAYKTYRSVRDPQATAAVLICFFLQNTSQFILLLETVASAPSGASASSTASASASSAGTGRASRTVCFRISYKLYIQLIDPLGCRNRCQQLRLGRTLGSGE